MTLAKLDWGLAELRQGTSSKPARTADLRRFHAQVEYGLS